MLLKEQHVILFTFSSAEWMHGCCDGTEDGRVSVLVVCVGRVCYKKLKLLCCPRACSSLQYFCYALRYAGRVKDIILRSLSSFWWVSLRSCHDHISGVQQQGSYLTTLPELHRPYTASSGRVISNYKYERKRARSISEHLVWRDWGKLRRNLGQTRQSPRRYLKL
jgi:hypothetical protein